MMWPILFYVAEVAHIPASNQFSTHVFHGGSYNSYAILPFITEGMVGNMVVLKNLGIRRFITTEQGTFIDGEKGYVELGQKEAMTLQASSQGWIVLNKSLNPGRLM